ncbi:hypothetical protein Tco_1286259 [Tanacetum coccineum]
MLPPLTKKPFTKPPTEKQIVVFIKTFGYGEDPKAKMISISTFVATRLHQPWRAILSVLNRSDSNMHSEGQDSPLTKLTNILKAKEAESKKAKADEEPEEQHVSPVQSGRGKGYMCSGDQEANVPNTFKKNVVPRKTRSLTVADNIVEEPVAVELAKSINTYAEWGQKLKGPVVEDPSLLDLRKGSKASRLESLKQAKQAVGGEGSNTDEAKDDETDDSDDFDMDLPNDKPKGDDDVVGFEVFMYNNSTESLKSTYLSPTVTCSSLDYIQNLLNETPTHELTDIMSHPVYTNAHTISVVNNPVGNPKIISYKSGEFEVPFGTHVDVQATNLVL